MPRVAKLSADLSEVSTLRLDKALLARIDDWRQVQLELPTTAYAIRLLVRLGLKAEGK